MLRLLQGDVGSGKTVVALLAMARAVEAGGQAALMAPTEILARQHLATITPLAERAGLTDRHPDRPRKGPRARRHAGRAGGRVDRHRDRHPCAVPGTRDIPRPGAGGGRRAASFRRAPAAGDQCQGRRAGHAGDDGDADPAHAGADRLRRHGRVAADRKARRTAADPHRDAAARPAGRADRADLRRGRGRPESLLDLPAGRGIRRDQADVGGGPFRDPAARIRRHRRARPRPHERRREGRGDARLQGGRDEDPRRDDRDRGRRRRARRDDHGDRARRAFRAGATAPAARARRARRQSRHPACCFTRIRSAKRPSGGCR